MASSLPKYDRRKTYRWNYDNAPNHRDLSESLEELAETPISPSLGETSWTFCGIPVASPLGIPAGPLLNSRWLLYYAALGFDVLTYKTVRSRYRACYDMPNLQPIEEELVQAGQVTQASNLEGESWAISFGMPSMAPENWRRDVALAREQLDPAKVLTVSVVASAESDWTLAHVAQDYARCATWAAESGADCIEVNFSCPNVTTVDGALDRDPQAIRCILSEVRQKIDDKKLIVKVGNFTQEPEILALLEACDGLADAISMTNCLACVVQAGGQPLFHGEKRGIGGTAILNASIEQVASFARLIQNHSFSLKLVGVGGVSSAEHAKRYLNAGAEAVHIATAAMQSPEIAWQIKKTW